MAILEKEVWVTVNQANISYFEEKGYKIPRYVDNGGVLRVKRGTTIKINVNDLSKSSRYTVTKICDDCGKNIPNQPYYRVTRGRKNVDGKDRCRSCVNKFLKRKYENSLENWAKINNKEYLLDEFSNKNEVNPSQITYSDNNYYLWNCNKCGSEFLSKVGNRTCGNTDCPYCSNQKVNHTNCLWTTHPNVAKLLNNSDDGYKYSKGSGKKLFFKCPDCGDVDKKNLNNVVRHGYSCNKCSDGFHYPEKFVINMLNQLAVKFKTQKIFDWSNKKRYDFYIPSINCIIETHGEQHYEEGTFNHLGGKTLLEEQLNDQIKEQLAKENGIENYVVIDCRRSELEFIKENVINSKLFKLLDLSNIEWLKCHEYACNTLVKEVCNLWNSSKMTTKEIGDILGFERSTIYRYLKQGNELGWCGYDPTEGIKRGISLNTNWNIRKVIQLSKTNEFIKEWVSISEVTRNLDINQTSIIKCCKGEIKTAGNYKWMYIEEYEKMKNKLEINTNEHFYTSEVVQLTLKGEFVKEWSSIIKASKTLSIKSSNISSVCRKKSGRAGDFIWRYKEDFYNSHEKIRPYKNNNTKEIVQLSKQGKFINGFKSITEASEHTGVSSSNISSVLRGKTRTAKGFKWMYKEEYDKLQEGNNNVKLKV